VRSTLALNTARPERRSGWEDTHVLVESPIETELYSDGIGGHVSRKRLRRGLRGESRRQGTLGTLLTNWTNSEIGPGSKLDLST
jgi:hypothetical protein